MNEDMDTRRNLDLAPADRAGERPHRGGAKAINVALQGGGSHGAFTWGVLDTLLGDPRIEIEAISGTSAGAMNAAVAADGLVEGGRERARERLEDFWRKISLAASASPIRRTPLDRVYSDWGLDLNPFVAVFDLMMHTVSPYQFNPWNINPLRDLMAKEIDFARVRDCDCVRLFISATDVRTGQARVFTGNEVTAEAVMASACLPTLFQAVEIGGVPYWDGGYMGNPVLFPFFECASPDVLLVQINPFHRENTPTTALEIRDRMNEIAFNSSLIKELKHVDFVNESLRRGDLAHAGLKELFLHTVDCLAFGELAPSSKLNAEWGFLTHLRDLGRRAMAAWIDTNFDAIGKRSTMDMRPFRAVPLGNERMTAGAGV